MPFTDPSPFGNVLVAFLSILFEGAPYILLGTIISGFIDAYLPSDAMDRILPKRRGPAILLAGVMGLAFPVCECAVIPVVRRLVQKGLPVACAITYLLAAPIVNPIVIWSTYSAFMGQEEWFVVFSRVLMAYSVTVFVGFIILRVPIRAILQSKVIEGIQRKAGEGSGEVAGEEIAGAKMIRALRTAMRDFLDTGMYFTIGVLITAVFNTQVNQEVFQPVAANEMLAIPAMMGLAFVLSLCSTSDAFIVAPMDTFSVPSKLAFLVYGPMMDIKLVFMYLSVFQRKFVLAMVVGLFVLVGLLSYAWAVGGVG